MKLRRKTGYSFVNCKKALETCGGDLKQVWGRWGRGAGRGRRAGSQSQYVALGSIEVRSAVAVQ